MNLVINYNVLQERDFYIVYKIKGMLWIVLVYIFCCFKYQDVVIVGGGSGFFNLIILLRRGNVFRS